MTVLDTIRKRPDNQKRFFSLITAGILTLIIVGFWFSFSRPTQTVAEKETSKLSSVSPVQVIKDEFARAVAGFKASTEQLSTSTIQVEVVGENATSTDLSTSSEKLN